MQRLWGRGGSGGRWWWEGARILLPHKTLSEGRNSDLLLASKGISSQERQMWTQAREEWSELGRGNRGWENTEKAGVLLGRSGRASYRRGCLCQALKDKEFDWSVWW